MKVLYCFKKKTDLCDDVALSWAGPKPHQPRDGTDIYGQ